MILEYIKSIARIYILSVLRHSRSLPATTWLLWTNILGAPSTWKWLIADDKKIGWLENPHKNL